MSLISGVSSHLDRLVFTTFHIDDDFVLKKFKTITFNAEDFEKLGEGFFDVSFIGRGSDRYFWVIKQKKHKSDDVNLPTDLLKHHFAFKIAEYFSDEVCKNVIDGSNQYSLRYVRPLIASAELVFKNGRRKNLDCFFKVEKSLPAKSRPFNRMTPSMALMCSRGGPKMLPQVFSRWTKDVTGGNAMICDVQGTNERQGEYWCTEPVVLCSNSELSIMCDGDGTCMNDFIKQYKHMLDRDGWLRDLDEQPCFKPDANQKRKMTLLFERLAKLADTALPGNIASMVQSKVRGRGRSRSY